jgi:Tol biopolymer transport system component
VELRGIADQPAPGSYGEKLFQATGVAPCLMAWGSTAGTANDFVYFSRTGEAGIYRTSESGGPRTPLVTMAELSKVFQIQYLPDASGIIYTFVDHSTSSQVYRYDFQSDSITQLTDLNYEFARDFAISPDGQFIVYERAPNELKAEFGGASDLWIMGIDGSNPRLLVTHGAHPSWIQNVTQAPAPTPVPPGSSTGTANGFKVYLPLVVKK